MKERSRDERRLRSLDLFASPREGREQRGGRERVSGEATCGWPEGHKRRGGQAPRKSRTERCAQLQHTLPPSDKAHRLSKGARSTSYVESPRSSLGSLPRPAQELKSRIAQGSLKLLDRLGQRPEPRCSHSRENPRRHLVAKARSGAAETEERVTLALSTTMGRRATSFDEVGVRREIRHRGRFRGCTNCVRLSGAQRGSLTARWGICDGRRRGVETTDVRAALTRGSRKATSMFRL